MSGHTTLRSPVHPGLSALATILLVTVGLPAEVPAQAPNDGGSDEAPAQPASGSVLRSVIHDRTDDHLRYPYTSTATDTWDILDLADEDPNNPLNILDVYKNATYPKAGAGNPNYNREHSWPNSYGFPVDNSSNYPYTDCHALFLSDSGYNSSRGNNPYALCDANCLEKPTDVNNGQGGGTGSYPGNSNWRTGSGSTGTWETWHNRQGDIARALFYLDVRYEGGVHGGTGAAEPDLILTDDRDLIVSDAANQPIAHMGLLSVLLLWHLDDPVDAVERHHNDVVASFQGNRNLFIDHPEWVACVFLDECEIFADGFESGDTSAWSTTTSSPTASFTMPLSPPGRQESGKHV